MCVFALIFGWFQRLIDVLTFDFRNEKNGRRFARPAFAQWLRSQCFVRASETYASCISYVCFLYLVTSVDFKNEL